MSNEQTSNDKRRVALVLEILRDASRGGAAPHALPDKTSKWFDKRGALHCYPIPYWDAAHKRSSDWTSTMLCALLSQAQSAGIIAPRDCSGPEASAQEQLMAFRSALAKAPGSGPGTCWFAFNDPTINRIYDCENHPCLHAT